MFILGNVCLSTGEGYLPWTEGGGGYLPWRGYLGLGGVPTYGAVWIGYTAGGTPLAA